MVPLYDHSLILDAGFTVIASHCPPRVFWIKVMYETGRPLASRYGHAPPDILQGSPRVPKIGTEVFATVPAALAGKNCAARLASEGPAPKGCGVIPAANSITGSPLS